MHTIVVLLVCHFVCDKGVRVNHHTMCGQQQMCLSLFSSCFVPGRSNPTSHDHGALDLIPTTLGLCDTAQSSTQPKFSISTRSLRSLPLDLTLAANRHGVMMPLFTIFFGVSARIFDGRVIATNFLFVLTPNTW